VHFKAKSIINAAGLYADEIASLIMKENRPSNYKLHFCKGHYFSYSGKALVSRLAYPVPDKDLVTLGIHTTVDLSGRMKFGPDAHYLDKKIEDYSVPLHLRDAFFNSVRKFIPSLEKDKIIPDYAGIRPKLAGVGEPFRDFIIEEETKLGFPGLVNLIGIESPGLTSSLAIAELVAKKLGFEDEVHM